MSDQTKIEWTDATWNPLRGCAKVSEGCRNCYAEKMASRFCGPGQPYEGTITNGRWNGQIRLVSEVLEQPLRWRKQRRIFVNSMSDLFHENVEFAHIVAIFRVMAIAQHHTFQILTKRPQRMLEVMNLLPEALKTIFPAEKHPEVNAPGWPLPNVWLGVSVENQRAADERIPLLLQTPAAVRFLSMEPLLGPVDLSACKPFDGECYCQEEPDGCKPRLANGCPEAAIDWVIVGGESGPGARPMHPDWVRSIRDQCQVAGVPFLFKQWGEWVPEFTWKGSAPIKGQRLFPDDGQGMLKVGKKHAGRLIDGRTWDEYPVMNQ